VCLERGPLSLMSTIEELFERKSSTSRLENREYGRRVHRANHAAPSIRKKLALTVGLVRSLTRATEFSYSLTPSCINEIVNVFMVAGHFAKKPADVVMCESR
jgi:hypothetical protein